MAILDAAMGMIPLRTPLESETVKLEVTTGDTVYPGDIVILAAGLVANYATGQEALGVCMDYAVAGEKATVCTAPDMTYRIKGNDNFADANVGQFCDLVSASAVNTATLRSAIVADTTNFAATAGTNDLLQCVGEYSVVTPVAEPQWFEVRLHTLTLSGAK